MNNDTPKDKKRVGRFRYQHDAFLRRSIHRFWRVRAICHLDEGSNCGTKLSMVPTEHKAFLFSCWREKERENYGSCGR